jgi:hypothetical protein
MSLPSTQVIQSQKNRKASSQSAQKYFGTGRVNRARQDDIHPFFVLAALPLLGLRKSLPRNKKYR